MTRRSEPNAAAGPGLDPVDALAQLAFLVHGLLERRAAEEGASIAQARLLGVLRDRRPTMNELGRLLGLDKSSVSGLVERAERRGLVARASSDEDRRSVLVALTGDGRALVSLVAARFQADVLDLLGRLGAGDARRLAELAGELVLADARARGVDLFESIVGADALCGSPACFGQFSR